MRTPVRLRSRDSAGSGGGGDGGGGGGSGGGARAMAPERPPFEHARVISTLRFAVMGFMCICAGPYGVEDAVAAAGALPTLVAVAALPLLWGFPQGMMTAELSSIVDENGGYILWCERALGPFWGWMNAYNSLLSNVFDLAAYPSLFGTYVATFLRLDAGVSLSSVEGYLVSLSALALIVYLNVKSLHAVGTASAALALFTVLPFAVQPILLVARGELFTKEVAANLAKDASDWGSGADRHIDWNVFTSVIMWNFSGWDSLSTFAGEVRRPKRTYPLGVAIVCLISAINYALPIVVGVAKYPDTSNWDSDVSKNTGTGDTSDGVNLVDIGAAMGRWMGVWVVLAGVVSALGQLNVVMSTTSRALWCMSTPQCGMLPPCLGKTWRGRPTDAGGTPAAAIFFQAAVVCGTASLTFPTIIAMDTLLNCVSLVLEMAAFLWLKKRAPHAPRPFAVPFGMPGAVAITLPKMALLVFTFATQKAKVLWAVLGCNVGFIALFFAREALRARARRARGGEGDAARALLGDGVDEEGAPFTEKGGKRSPLPPRYDGSDAGAEQEGNHSASPAPAPAVVPAPPSWRAYLLGLVTPPTEFFFRARRRTEDGLPSGIDVFPAIPEEQSGSGSGTDAGEEDSLDFPPPPTSA